MSHRLTLATLAAIVVATCDGTAGAQADSRHSHITPARPGGGLLSASRFDSLARRAAARFSERDSAIAGGYRRIGLDFPAMGQHWVKPSLLIDGHFDAAQPALLSYAMVDERPVLTGLVYAVPLDAGQLPPDVPGAGDLWHEHNSTVDDESALPAHRGGASRTDGVRLAVLHMWVGIPNPEGMFVAENWALPFARLGIAPPRPLPLGAARAISLLAGGKEYFMMLAGSSPAASPAIARALDECAKLATSIAQRARVRGSASADDVRRLDDAWRATLQGIALASDSTVALRLNGGRGLEP
ncbi:MAG: hypothetical protein NVS4B3_13060 [Gemmatimonadaceae bacterium]